MSTSLRNLSSVGILALSMCLFHCGKSRTMEIIQEPVVDQVSIHSPEICLDSYIWVIPANPCIAVRGLKDNTTGKQDFQLIYRLSSFDVEFPLGVSMELDKEFHNLVKVQTEYGSTLELISSIPESLIQKIEKSSSIGISYTNRRETINYELSSRQKSRLVEYTLEIQKILGKEPKMKIRR